MTVKEFSYEFDLIYNNISSNISAPGLTEYEKSVFLTMAQKDLVIQLSQTYEQDSSSSLLLKEIMATTNLIIPEGSKSPFKLSFPTDCLKICREELNDNNNILIIATKTDYVYKNLRNPYKKPSTNRALRVIEDNKMIIYFGGSLTSYTISYIKKPTPIILEDLTDEGITIDGHTEAMTSPLNDILHSTIVRQAAEMASNIYKSK